MRRVIIYTSSDFPYGGAPENFVRLMANGLNINGIDVEVVRIKGRKSIKVNDTSINATDFFTWHFPSNGILKYFYYLFLIISIPISLIYQYVKNKADTILLYGIDYSYLVAPFLFGARVSGVRIYRIITDYYPRESIVSQKWESFKYHYYLRQFSNYDKKMDGIIVLSRYLRELEISNGVPNDNIIIIPHFIEVKEIGSVEIQDNIIIGFCGSTIVDNGIVDLVKAFSIVHSQIPSAKLKIIGSPTQDLNDAIHRYCSTFFHNVIITGFVDKSNVDSELSTCSILVNPRIMNTRARAGFPTKLGEYFAMKKPVVSTDVGDINYYFEDKNQLVISKSNDPTSLAECIIFLINNPETAREIASRGYQWASQHLDYIHNAKLLLDFINDTKV